SARSRSSAPTASRCATRRSPTHCSPPASAARTRGCACVPEGDTIHLAATRLHAALAGQELTHSDLRVPRLATVDLAGRRVEAVAARGKHLLMRLAGGLTLHSHLRMDGSWHLYRPDERWRGGPAFEVRAVLVTAPWTAV